MFQMPFMPIMPLPLGAGLEAEMAGHRRRAEGEGRERVVDGWESSSRRGDARARGGEDETEVDRRVWGGQGGRDLGFNTVGRVGGCDCARGV